VLKEATGGYMPVGQKLFPQPLKAEIELNSEHELVRLTRSIDWEELTLVAMDMRLREVIKPTRCSRYNSKNNSIRKKLSSKSGEELTRLTEVMDMLLPQILYFVETGSVAARKIEH